MLGHSGARVCVNADMAVKTGAGVRAQADYLAKLPEVCTPRVLSVCTKGYTMERLYEPKYRIHGTRPWLLQAAALLPDHYWSRPPAATTAADWREQLDAWAEERRYRWLVGLARRVHPRGQDQPVLIHGDPTAANIMRRHVVDAAGERDGDEVVLIDPIAPMGKVPSLPAVDAGKLLQSALGWENVLEREVDVPWGGMAAEVLTALPMVDPRQAWFWCAVHCARVVPYAKRTAVRTWALARSREAARAVRV